MPSCQLLDGSSQTLAAPLAASLAASRDVLDSNRAR